MSTKPFIPYVRVSDVNGREGESYTSPTDQLKSITNTARGLDVDLHPGEFKDEDRTGSTFLRPEWERAIELVQSGEAAGIIAYNLARMSRGKTGEVLEMVEDVETAGGKLYDEHGLVSVKSADDEMITTVKAMINRREWRQRRADRMRSVENAIGRGVHLSAPFGYRKGDDGRLVPVPDEARQVWRAFDLRASGLSWPAVADQLNAKGAKPRPYKRDGEVRQAVWTHKTVRQIVMSEVYLGVAFNGPHRHPDAHPAIVEPELFARANRAKGTKPVGPSEGYLLTGLVRCNGCGYAMTNANESGGRYYRCRSRQHGDGRCPSPANVPAGQLEAWVVEQFKAAYLNGHFEPVADDAGVIAAQDGVARAKAKLTAALKLRIELDETTETERELVDEQLERARAVLREAELALMEARMAARGADLPPELTAEVFDGAPVEERRHWLSIVYAAVVVRASTRWREPAADRARLVLVDAAPGTATALRAFVAALTV